MERRGALLAIVYLAAALLAGGVGGYLAGTGLTPEATPPPATPSSTPSYAVVNITGSPEDLVEMAYSRVSPSVVHITSTVLTRDFFFNIVPQQGTGSGIVVSEDGYVLTNNHVIEDASQINITLADGSTYEGELVGSDPGHDIAVVRIVSPPPDLKPAPLGDSDALKVGDMVVAIGNPFGLDRTATLGIVSSLNRSIIGSEGQAMRGLIQTDASINPGNSGGPLVNSRGEVVGINSAILSTSGGNIGIGFAIPINTAKESMEAIIARGREVEMRPWLGISGVTVTPALSRLLNLPVDEGAMVVDVVPGSPADEAGLRGGEATVIYNGQFLTIGGDILTEAGGKKIASMQELANIVASKEVGDQLEITYIRSGKVFKTTATLAKRR